jgi:putative SOS response-associated peptidase YedK
LIQEFALGAGIELQLPLRYNIAPTQEVPIVRQTDGQRRLSLARWGLIPSWADDPKIGNRMINARSEEIAAKPAFRGAIKSRRCLIPADGFFEWRKEGSRKQPYYIRLRDERPFAFAGLWERWNKSDGPPIESCTILTTTANDTLKPLHDRRPVILSPNDYGVWLDAGVTDPTKLNYLYEPYPGDELLASPCNPVVNSAKSDCPECIELLKAESVEEQSPAESRPAKTDKQLF